MKNLKKLILSLSVVGIFSGSLLAMQQQAEKQKQTEQEIKAVVQKMVDNAIELSEKKVSAEKEEKTKISAEKEEKQNLLNAITNATTTSVTTTTSSVSTTSKVSQKQGKKRKGEDLAQEQTVFDLINEDKEATQAPKRQRLELASIDDLKAAVMDTLRSGYEAGLCDGFGIPKAAAQALGFAVLFPFLKMGEFVDVFFNYEYKAPVTQQTTTTSSSSSSSSSSLSSSSSSSDQKKEDKK